LDREWFTLENVHGLLADCAATGYRSIKKNAVAVIPQPPASPKEKGVKTGRVKKVEKAPIQKEVGKTNQPLSVVEPPALSPLEVAASDFID